MLESAIQFTDGNEKTFFPSISSQLLSLWRIALNWNQILLWILNYHYFLLSLLACKCLMRHETFTIFIFKMEQFRFSSATNNQCFFIAEKFTGLFSEGWSWWNHFFQILNNFVEMCPLLASSIKFAFLPDKEDHVFCEEVQFEESTMKKSFPTFLKELIPSQRILIQKF